MSIHFTFPSPHKALFGAVAALVCAFGATGCMATVEAEPVAYAAGPAVGEEVVYVDTVPANIEAYPCEYYGGTYVYLVGGRWYARSPHGWAYYRAEPIELGRRRVVYESSPRYYHPAPAYGYRPAAPAAHPVYRTYRAPAVHVSHHRRGRG